LKTSLLISIYKKNSNEELNRCFSSIKNQIHIPEEIILIVDGPIADSVFFDIKKWCEVLPIKIFKLDTNMGLAFALNYGLKLCTYDWVFRMDIDDVCAEGRFQKQIEYIGANTEIDILGGNILCFESFLDLFSGRNVPTTFNEINRFLKFRNPINHPSVFFNRKKILDIGGYPNARLGQDYLLWINSVINNLKIENTKDVLVYMQLDKNSYRRRGFRSLKYDTYPYFVMYKHKITNVFELFVGLSMRFAYSTYCEIRSMVNL
jgi:glycosyltransferase involved in cell wall biosynthesis